MAAHKQPQFVAMHHKSRLIDCRALLAATLLAFAVSAIAQAIDKPSVLDGLSVQSKVTDSGEFVAFELLTEDGFICGNLSTITDIPTAFSRAPLLGSDGQENESGVQSAY